MDLDNLTIGEFKQLAAMFGGAGASHSYKVGDSYLIRTVTYHMIGKVRAVTDTDIVLDGASWLASSGRFGAALASGNVEEVEYVGDGYIVGRGGIIDSSPWKHKLPEQTK